MTPTQILFTATLYLSVISGVIALAFLLAPYGERITTQQYREQSLQYLEDIRNSNDIIQANCTK